MNEMSAHNVKGFAGGDESIRRSRSPPGVSGESARRRVDQSQSRENEAEAVQTHRGGNVTFREERPTWKHDQQFRHLN